MIRLCTLLLLPMTAAAQPAVEQIAVIEQDRLVEASGLARSQIHPGVLWAMNDSGAKPRLYAFDATGTHRGRLTLDPSKNRDWEDLASFTLDDTAYLLVADIGDNMSKRKTLSLYIVEEPDIEADNKVRSEPSWRIRFRYPDGPRDAEAAAVDVEDGYVYILSKRSLPPELYRVPLTPTDGVVTAEKLGQVRSLPPPRRIDVELAPKTKDWHWQPTAMDFTDDGRTAVVMTYRYLFVYRRQDGEAWFDALNRRPDVISLGGFRDAESTVLSTDGASVFVTTESKHPPLLKALLPDTESD
ncbi:MAG: hypothetical protein AAF660_15490 [Pseudomonadota bacterium]